MKKLFCILLVSVLFAPLFATSDIVSSGNPDWMAFVYDNPDFAELMDGTKNYEDPAYLEVVFNRCVSGLSNSRNDIVTHVRACTAYGHYLALINDCSKAKWYLNKGSEVLNTLEDTEENRYFRLACSFLIKSNLYLCQSPRSFSTIAQAGSILDECHRDYPDDMFMKQLWAAKKRTVSFILGGNVREAYSLFSEMLQDEDVLCKPDLFDVLYGLGSSALTLGKKDQALDCAKRALELYPKSPEALELLGKIK